MSAASRATSTAESTEIPQSLSRMAAASFTPSPMYATACPRLRRVRTTRAFWAGESLAKMLASWTATESCSSVMSSTSVPVRTRSAGMPMARQTWAATRAESPVRTFVDTPCAVSARTAAAELCLGGSRKAR